MHMINDPTSTLAKGSDFSILTTNAVHASTLEDENQTLTYNDVPRSMEARQADSRLLLVRNWLDTLTRPTEMSDADYATFMGYCQSFFVASSKLWRKNSQGYHKLVVISDSRIDILRSAHDKVAHKGFYATNSLIAVHSGGHKCVLTLLGL